MAKNCLLIWRKRIPTIWRIFFVKFTHLSITARGIPASIVPLERSFLGLITLRTASVLAIIKYKKPMPTTRCRVGPSLGLTIPKPKLTIITSILKKNELKIEKIIATIRHMFWHDYVLSKKIERRMTESFIIESCQTEDCQNWRLPKLKVAKIARIVKIENC